MHKNGFRLVSFVATLTVLSSTGLAAPKKKGGTKDKSAQEGAKTGKDAAAADASKKPDAVALNASVTPYDALLIDGNRSFAAASAGGSADDAVATYRKAISSEPNRPEGHLFLGAALFQKGDFAAADEAATNAANRARADRSFTNFLGKALFLSAMTKEALLRLDDAKTAWRAYGAFAKENPDQAYPAGSGDAPPMLVKVYPGSAVDREAKIESFQRLTNDSAKVKELVLKRQRELGGTK